MNFEEFVHSYIEARGYGKWYQREAWEHFRNYPLSGHGLTGGVRWLNETYPDLYEE